MNDSSSRQIKTALKQVLVLSINFIGFIGAFLVVYSIVAAITGSNWPVLENIAVNLAVYTTLIGTVLVACSVYFPVNTRPPDPLSTFFTAPVVILAVIIALGSIWFFGRTPSVHLISGFSILAISGSLFRLLSR